MIAGSSTRYDAFGRRSKQELLMTHSIRSIVLLVLLSTLSIWPERVESAPPIPNPDFTAGERIPPGADHDWNLGPTGLRGWMHCDGMETDTARQIMVTEVDPGSPADGRVEVGDVILGIGTRPFKLDPRIEFGRAIGRAERSGGRLVLLRWRDGRRDRVTLDIPVLGRYADTAPFDCRKSERILERGCDAVAAKLAADPGRGTPIERSYAALALLAGGDPAHLPVIRDQVARAARYTDPDRRQYHSWFYGPQIILVAEYIMATDDRSFMPDLERLALEIARGQSDVGSWGHRFIQESGRLAGYGMMNAPGIPMLIGLALARKAGVDSPEVDVALEKGSRLIRFYVGKGSVPYGDHDPWIEHHDDNGKNGAAAVLFNLLGDVDATEYFSRMSVACHGVERDTGHTGNYFNMLWAMPGVALSGPEASGAWMEEFGWYYDLAPGTGPSVIRALRRRSPTATGTGMPPVRCSSPTRSPFVESTSPAAPPRRRPRSIVAPPRTSSPTDGTGDLGPGWRPGPNDRSGSCFATSRAGLRWCGSAPRSNSPGATAIPPRTCGRCSDATIRTAGSARARPRSC